jgi:hypothetical protein
MECTKENYIYDVMQMRLNYESELPNNFWRKSPILNFNNICATVYGIHVHLWPYVNEVLLQTNMAGNWDCITTLPEVLHIKILRKFAQQFRH